MFGLLHAASGRSGALVLLLASVLAAPRPAAADVGADRTASEAARQAERAEAPSSSRSDTASSAYEVLHAETDYAFRDDGTGRRTFTAHIRVHTEAGVSALGQLSFAYSAAFEEPEIDYVRVHKPGGDVVRADESDVHDRSLPAGAAAPVYNDARALHVAVPRLRPGDRLEARLSVEIPEAVVPGHFFVEDVFWRGVPVEEEIIRVRVPAGRSVRVAGAAGEPSVEERQGKRVYEWTHSVEDPGDEGTGLGDQASALTQRDPDVLVSSFGSWREVSDWYRSLVAPALETDGRVAALADSLTEGLETERERARALYRYVAREVRYVAVLLGAGRYEPHSALETLENGYGDCKDQHVLLASLLASQGIESRGGLLHTSRESVDRTVPSPSQFDHVVSVVEVDGSEVWLDATTGVAPFGHLPGHLRDKPSLVVGDGAGGELVRTTADPGVENREDFTIRGRLTGEGSLEADGELTARGDPAILLRSVLRRLPRGAWERLMERMLAEMGLAGDVSEVDVSHVEDTSAPVTAAFRVTVDDWLDAAAPGAELQPPFPELDLPEASGDDGVRLAGPITFSHRVAVELPPVHRAVTPEALDVERPWARYESRYALTGDTLVSERNMTLTEPAVPDEEVSAYEDFLDAVRRDEDSRFRITLDVAAAAPDAGDRPPAADRSGTDDPDFLARLGGHAMQQGNPEEAERLFRRVVELEPEHPYAWNDLGLALTEQEKYAEAEEALRRQIELVPDHQQAHTNLGRALWGQGRRAEAEAAFRRQLEGDPRDRWATANLGVLLLEAGEADEAEDHLRTAIEVNPDRRRELRLRLVESLQAQGRSEEARQLLEEVAPGMLGGADADGGPEASEHRAAADRPEPPPTPEQGASQLTGVERLRALAALLEADRVDRAASILYEELLRKDRIRRRPDALGRIVMKVAEPGRVLEALRAAEADDDRRSVYLQGAASLSLYLGRLGDALEDARRAKGLDPEDASAWVLLGRAEYMNVNRTRALFAYRRARALEPDVFSENPEDRANWRELEGD